MPTNTRNNDNKQRNMSTAFFAATLAVMDFIGGTFFAAAQHYQNHIIFMNNPLFISTD